MPVRGRCPTRSRRGAAAGVGRSWGRLAGTEVERAETCRGGQVNGHLAEGSRDRLRQTVGTVRRGSGTGTAETCRGGQAFGRTAVNSGNGDPTERERVDRARVDAGNHLRRGGCPPTGSRGLETRAEGQSLAGESGEPQRQGRRRMLAGRRDGCRTEPERLGVGGKPGLTRRSHLNAAECRGRARSAVQADGSGMVRHRMAGAKPSKSAEQTWFE
ncbi:hypothetical protein GCM10027360_59040 [Amycolatopsis echigonensis]